MDKQRMDNVPQQQDSNNSKTVEVIALCATALLSSNCSERIAFRTPAPLVGQVEVWMDVVISHMRESLHGVIRESLLEYRNHVSAGTLLSFLLNCACTHQAIQLIFVYGPNEHLERCCKCVNTHVRYTFCMYAYADNFISSKLRIKTDVLVVYFSQYS